MIKISIFTCCYNHEKYLERCINSILRQTYKNWELVCVDDKSTDNSLKILQDFAEKDKRIRVIEKENNSGMAAPNCNIALKYLDGEFILGVGPDDEISENCLQEFINVYSDLEDEEIDAIIIPTLFYFIENKEKNFIMSGVKGTKNSENRILTGKEAFELSIDWKISGFAFFRTNIVKKFGFYEEGMNGDEYSCREFFLNSRNVAFLKKSVYIYHQINTSITKKLSTKLFNTYKTLYKVEELAKKYKLKKTLIREINKKRYRETYNLWDRYLKNRENFSASEQQVIEGYFREDQELLQPYKAIRDYFFRKEYDKKGKFIVVFDKIRICYKRLKYA
ncbi:TPA: glycosyltransferase family 2 protein [Campylobacter coli]|nr:glycosyltransferase family 2 protein [Campylobacter coli]HEB9345625.1 glycosyltransferase family 2 protein [Campylobacter coli]HEC1736848.1 glycosyltransferase family 2 protein [Campylobacter coli]HEF1919102.1 glycosyltransferase family 2 protein [Campylobacter coli]